MVALELIEKLHIFKNFESDELKKLLELKKQHGAIYWQHG